MRILVVAVGTRGDVAPYTGLGVRMAEAGHEVTVAAYDRFAGLVRGCGLEFCSLPGDPRAAQVMDQTSHDRGGIGVDHLVRPLRMSTDDMVEHARHVRRAAEGWADALVLSLPATLNYHVAQRLGLPSMGVYLQPGFPTREHPPALLGFGRSAGAVGNRLAGRLVVSVSGWVAATAIGTVRRELGLPPVGRGALRRAMLRWPVQHGYSRAVLPRPADWRPELDVAGYLWPADDKDYRPPPRLAEFLAAGPPPVYIGFGSLALRDGERLSAVIRDAVRAAGVRAVVNTGWSDLRTDDEDLLTIADVPHSWLLPRTAAVVHHGGAGTTGAALRAGRPSVAVPAVADQPFWGSRLAQLGVGPRPVRYRRLTADALADALRGLTRHRPYRERAEELAARIATEDGAGHVAAAVERLVRSRT